MKTIKKEHKTKLNKYKKLLDEHNIEIESLKIAVYNAKQVDIRKESTLCLNSYYLAILLVFMLR